MTPRSQTAANGHVGPPARQRREKTVTIVQSSYIPWKGYFDLIGLADELILFDTVQYTRRDWRNRNKIKTSSGPAWLTIPVASKRRFHQRIDETVVTDQGWPVRHWRSIVHSYAKAPHFAAYRERLEELFLGTTELYLSEINRRFLEALCSMLGIDTTFTSASEFSDADGKTERLVHLCRQAGADVYLSGPAARDYIDEGLFEAAGIRLRYMDYSGYSEYDQLYPPFEHQVSVIDLILNTGVDARNYLKCFHAEDSRAPGSAVAAT